MPGLLQQLRVTPLKDSTIGAEVEGLDFSEPLPDDVSDQLLAALHQHGVLVARSTNVDDETMIALGQKWGPLDNILPHIKAGTKKYRFPDKPEIFDVGNINVDNEIIDPNDLGRMSGRRGNATWHNDGGFNPRRSGVSIIRAVEVPPAGQGGETEFLDSRTAYADLSKDKKQEIKNYVGMNTILWNRQQANPDMEEFKNVDFNKVQLAKHRIAQTHEPTGRGTLYIGSYTHHIEGLSFEDSRKILNPLLEHLSQDKYKLTINYDNPGDLVFWDNSAVQHRGTLGAFEGKYRRDMRRISTFDMGPWGYGENDPEVCQQIGI